MTLPLRFGLLDSAYNEFLFAIIGEDENGQEVSVISGLTRLGEDPWEEARRLGKMPSGAATKSLALTIAKLDPAQWEHEAPHIATRLIPLLPKGGAPSISPPIPLRSDARNVLVLLRVYWAQSILLVVLALVLAATYLK